MIFYSLEKKDTLIGSVTLTCSKFYENPSVTQNFLISFFYTFKTRAFSASLLKSMFLFTKNNIYLSGFCQYLSFCFVQTEKLFSNFRKREIFNKNYRSFHPYGHMENLIVTFLKISGKLLSRPHIFSCHHPFKRSPSCA